jgi:ribosomal protein L16 Arg81 hydroxylase
MMSLVVEQLTTHQRKRDINQFHDNMANNVYDIIINSASLRLVFLSIFLSPTTRDNIQKSNASCMIVTHKLLKDVIAALQENEGTMRDKWLTLAAWKTQLYSRYDFRSGLDLSLQQLKKELTLFGPISKKLSAGNDTAVRSVFDIKTKEYTRHTLPTGATHVGAIDNGK